MMVWERFNESRIKDLLRTKHALMLIRSIKSTYVVYPYDDNTKYEKDYEKRFTCLREIIDFYKFDLEEGEEDE